MNSVICWYTIYLIYIYVTLFVCLFVCLWKVFKLQKLRQCNFNEGSMLLLLLIITQIWSLFTILTLSWKRQCSNEIFSSFSIFLNFLHPKVLFCFLYIAKHWDENLNKFCLKFRKIYCFWTSPSPKYEILMQNLVSWSKYLKLFTSLFPVIF
jgi:hypothetical protein